ncbi:methionine gamma-lyase family protein [bacterium]|nr:methionine gamma-lyase family protein [bacterium]
MTFCDYLRSLRIDGDFVELAAKAGEVTREVREAVRERAALNQWKVLEALQSAGLMEGHFFPTTGYGLGDMGREVLDEAVAKIFRAEAGCMRWQIASGTHALTAALFGTLAPGKSMLSITGAPYDTMLPVIGNADKAPGTLAYWGVGYRELPLREDGHIDIGGIADALKADVGLVYLQRSRGYTWRPSLCVKELAEAIAEVRRHAPEVTVMVDNCYGEMVELSEPTEFGADIVGGSLIKNLGGAFAPCGGYLAGKKQVIERALERVIAPGVGVEEGPTLGYNRVLAQGLFMSPNIIGAALEGAVWSAWILEQLGFKVSPRWDEPRTDIIQAICLESTERQIAFCRGIQKAGAVDHSAMPEPVVQPGYRDPIIMAGGTFIQGSSIELSADGPLRPPYACYLQGGMSFAHVQLGLMLALQEMRSQDLL